MIDGKEYAKQMRENVVIDENGNIIVSEELWQQIADVIEEFAEKLKEKADVWEDEGYYFKYVTTDDIDEMVAEMVGADNE